MGLEEILDLMEEVGFFKGGKYPPEAKPNSKAYVSKSLWSPSEHYYLLNYKM